MFKFFNLPMTLICLGGLLTLAGGLLANYRANKEKLQAAIREKDFTNELLAKNDEISKLSIYNLDMLTGGDSFPFLDPTFNVSSPEQMDFWLVNGGQYPLYDVTVTIIDLIKLRQITEKRKSSEFKGPIFSNDFTSKINVGNMRPAEIAIDFLSVKTPTIGEIKYQIEIVSRNCFVEQIIHAKFSGEKDRKILLFETKVNGKERQNLYEKISTKK